MSKSNMKGCWKWMEWSRLRAWWDIGGGGWKIELIIWRMPPADVRPLINKRHITFSSPSAPYCSVPPTSTRYPQSTPIRLSQHACPNSPQYINAWHLQHMVCSKPSSLLSLGRGDGSVVTAPLAECDVRICLSIRAGVMRNRCSPRLLARHQYMIPYPACSLPPSCNRFTTVTPFPVFSPIPI